MMASMEFKVRNEITEPVGIIIDHTECNIALVAEQSPNSSGDVTVVSVVSPPLTHGWSGAHRTDPALSRQKVVPCLGGYSVEFPEVLLSGTFGCHWHPLSWPMTASVLSACAGLAHAPAPTCSLLSGMKVVHGKDNFTFDARLLDWYNVTDTTPRHDTTIARHASTVELTA